MYNFFSFMSSRNGQKFYFNWEQRKEREHKNCDNYLEIAKHFNVKENELHKWRYNPLTQELTFNSEKKVFEEDESQVLAWCKGLDFKTIIEPLIIKPIIDPRKVKKHKWTKEDEKNLREWDLEERYTGRYLMEYIKNRVGDSVMLSINKNILDSFGESIYKLTKGEAGETVYKAIIAYNISFYDLIGSKSCSCLTKLWERGFMPCGYGYKWRIRQGEDMKVIKEFEF